MAGGFDEDCDYLFKAVLIGDSGVGKSNLLSRLAKDEFCLDSKATVGVEFTHRSVKVGDKLMKAQIWDTAGQDRFRAITSSYYRGALGALLIYYISSRGAYRNVSKWLKELRELGNEDMVVVLIGNKSDLGHHSREVCEKEGKSFAEKEKIFFMATSAMQNLNVEEAFLQMIHRIHDITSHKILQTKLNRTTSNLLSGEEIVLIDEVTPTKQSNCCTRVHL